ncbi:MAG: protein kinase domain-containing protein [Planctomycetota bacterium]
MAWLIVETGNDKGSKIELPPDAPPILVGRLKNCGLTLTDCMASRHHCKVFYKGEVFLLEDLDSHNGTYLNRKKLADTQPLHDGDRILIGNSLISYREELGKSVGAHTGKTIGDYKIVRLLGVGGMGEVYEAQQKSLDRRVAVKILAPELATDSETVDRMIREARNAGKLNHPNVVQVHDVGKADGIYYYSMELVPGGSIQDLITGGRRVDPEKAVKFLYQAAAGLAYAEKQGIVHCDIKPDNLMLAADETVRLADLGISKTLVDGKADQSEGVFGSPHYMSPEQAQGLPLTCRSDIYSLGVTAYRMLSGHLPFDGTTAREIMEHHVFDEPHSLRENAPYLSARLIEIVEKMLQKNPAQRYQSARELMDDLGSVEKAMRDGTYLPTILQLKNRNSVRIKKRDNQQQRRIMAIAWGVIGLGALMVAALAVWSSLSSGPHETPVNLLMQKAARLVDDRKLDEARTLYEQALRAKEVTPDETTEIHGLLAHLDTLAATERITQERSAARDAALKMDESTPPAMLKKLHALQAAGCPADSEEVTSLTYQLALACGKEIDDLLLKAGQLNKQGHPLAAAALLAAAPEYIPVAVKGTEKYGQPWNNLKSEIAPALSQRWAKQKAACEKLAAAGKIDEAWQQAEDFRVKVACFDLAKQIAEYEATLKPPAPVAPLPPPPPPTAPAGSAELPANSTATPVQ